MVWDDSRGSSSATKGSSAITLLKAPAQLRHAWPEYLRVGFAVMRPSIGMLVVLLVSSLGVILAHVPLGKPVVLQAKNKLGMGGSWAA